MLQPGNPHEETHEHVQDNHPELLLLSHVVARFAADLGQVYDDDHEGKHEHGHWCEEFDQGKLLEGENKE